MKRIALSVVAILFFNILLAQTFPFQDTSLHIDERVEDLLSRLTLEEKLSMMQHRNPAIPSLGLPAYSWWNEALHGVARNGYATVWPTPVALAASFNTPMVFDIFSEVAIEANAKYAAARHNDTCVALREPTDYTGLTFFTPNVNIFRDPRWGRGMETYGEDPHLTATMGLACVNGLQHSHMPYRQGHRPEQYPTPLTAAACIKHLAAHSGPEGVRHEFDALVSPRDLWTTYLPAFEYIIRNSDVQQVMCGYNRLNGTPCCTNKELLVDILRNQWHYDGLLVTDCWALNDCWERDTVIPRHKTHPTAAATAADAFGTEVDLECGSGLAALRTAVDSGYISEQKINEHVRRILRTRLRAELHAPLQIHPDRISPVQACAESLVLLRNEKNLLPLPEHSTKIFLAGPNSEDTLMPLGNYNGTPFHTVSIREGLENHFVLVDRPGKADVIIYAGGLSPQLEGEELQVDIPGFYKGDRTRIELPQDQNKELHRLQRKGKPVILLLCSSSAVALDSKAQQCDAILACWYGGEAMGEAVAAALAGKYDCFGRLPVTWYRSTEQLPPFDDYSMTNRTYRYLDDSLPLYPFGFGLNYATATIESKHVDWDRLRVSGTIRCTEQCAAPNSTTVVKVFMTRHDDPEAPKKSLVAYKKVSLPPAGACVPFEIELDPFWLRHFDEQRQGMEEWSPSDRITLTVTL